MSSDKKLNQIIEAALLAAGGPLSLDGILELFAEEERPEKKALREAIKQLQIDYEDRGFELVEVGGGFRINVRAEFAPWVSRLWEERPARYSRALMETLALIAYRQPITRGEIEDIRGVSVSTNIMKTLMERDWVRVVGQRDVPGKPSIYATTKEFLNYFGMKGLDELPTLQEIRDLDSINRELELEATVPSAKADDAGRDSAAEDEEGDISIAELADSVEALITDSAEVADESGVDSEPVADPEAQEETETGDEESGAIPDQEMQDTAEEPDTSKEESDSLDSGQTESDNTEKESFNE